jgi:hypothetical protein
MHIKLYIFKHWYSDILDDIYFQILTRLHIESIKLTCQIYDLSHETMIILKQIKINYEG